MTSKRFYSSKHSTLEQRLDHYTDKSGGPDACWTWTGHITRHGYGRLNWNKSRKLAHRLVWEVAHGPIPPDKPHILHRCDVPACCNPAHLWAGTQADNVADMMAKGRGQHGERNGNAKLTDDQVRAIRAAVGPQKAIGAQYGLGKGQVSMIRSGQRWRHVDG